MLFQEETSVALRCQWPVYHHRPASKHHHQHRDDPRKDGGSRHRWHKKCGRGRGYWGARQGRGIGPHPHPQSGRKKNRPRARPTIPTGTSLRPVNTRGSGTAGMRAPENTNQFLMHEKYQMMHMRSDSVGTDSGSDCEMDFTDMESYLGVLENARGALLDLDSPLQSSWPHPDPDPARVLPPGQRAQRQTTTPPFPFFTFGELLLCQEESMQYFPSEDDVIQSEDFMQRDFIEFCDTFSGTEHTA